MVTLEPLAEGLASGCHDGGGPADLDHVGPPLDGGMPLLDDGMLGPARPLHVAKLLGLGSSACAADIDSVVLGVVPDRRRYSTCGCPSVPTVAMRPRRRPARYSSSKSATTLMPS